MKAQLIVLSMMSAYASAAAVTGCRTIVENGISITACGNADGTYTYTPGVSGSANGVANGNITANVDQFGKIVVEGSVDGKGQINQQGFSVDGAANGRVTGKDILVEGAMAGKAGASFVNETAWAQGAINGRARAFGYGAEGAATGSIRGDLDGNIQGNGAVNGCYFQPNGLRYCFSNNGQYIGYIGGGGQFIPGTVPPTNVGGGSGSGSFKPNTQNPSAPQPTNPGPSSSASQMEVMSGLAVVLGAAALMF